MAYYEKKIVYLSLLENGDKIKNAGFVKMEITDTYYKMDMRISGLPIHINKKCNITFVTYAEEEYVVDKIMIHNGGGNWSSSFKGGIIQNTVQDVIFENIRSFYVEISESQAIEGVFAKKEAPVKQKKIEIKKQSEKRKFEVKKEILKPEIFELKAGSIPVPEIVKEENEKQKSKNNIIIDKVILNDKWQQLLQIYPVVHPYEDDREYVSIEPKDFVIMTGDYQHLANNSFLLHGFYNYRHIILGKEQDTSEGIKEEKKNEHNFYLGVPGVYYEREKMVALMFGFEAFECVGGKAEPGKFGYYLRKIQI